MSDADHITDWIDGVRHGDSLAAEQLWNAYFDKLIRVARQQMQGAKKGIADEEDVALSAFKSFCLAAREGRFEKLVDRESLWPLLVSITAHKSVDAIRYENRKKRGGTGSAEPDAAADDPDADHWAKRVELNSATEFLDRGPSPEFAAQLSELFQWLMNELDATDDPQLRQVALMKLEGSSTNEIAQSLGCARRTVERKMLIVRHLLTQRTENDRLSGDGVSQ